MNKQQLDQHINSRLIKNNKLIASAVQWGLIENISSELDIYVQANCSSSVEKLFRYLNNDFEEHKCYCGKPAKFENFSKGFRKFCSVSCSRKSKSTQDKFHLTMMKKYGCYSPLDKNGIIWRKIQKTNIEKYGDIYPFRWGSKLSKESMLKKYGVEHSTALADSLIKQQISQKKNFAPKSYLTKFGNKIFYQSKSELYFIEACEENNVFIENGPVIPYYLNNKKHYYHVDFKTKNLIVEIKSSHHYYSEALNSGEIDAKNMAATSYAKENNVDFMFLLDKSKHYYNEILRREI